MNLDVVPADGGETLWVVADRIRFLGGLSGSDLELLDIEVPPGSGTPPHTHRSPEMFHILEGELTVREFGAGRAPRTVLAGPGTAVRIPSMLPHNYSNESGGPVRMLVLIEKTMIDFFRDIGASEPQGEPDFAKIGAAMQRHGIEPLTMAA
ncbi:cupin domain-containing protein [Methylobrevis pamukkalensis]|uniref:Cupin domain protein n=1 Tax=Methylobrevis pamukkalensis TaxID=1439726 RepID=A0A1E3GXZ7_9HYPH|nr:cupin domain-containing protein [Methylobrevis pamukkalensis]ODN68949.1 Cupin domain protein [Methylobrevis pamukkalensis]